MKLIALTFLAVLFQVNSLQGQEKLVEDVKVSSTKALLYKKTKGINSLESLLSQTEESNKNFNSKKPSMVKAISATKNSRFKSEEDALWQKDFAQIAYPADGTIVNRNGLNNAYPIGDIGKHFYVQVAGQDVAVLNKDGVIVAESTLDEIRGEEIATKNQAVVLYDQEYGRWLFFEATINLGFIITVSKDENPLGEMTVYTVENFNVFLNRVKYSIWTNSISGSTTDFSQKFTSFLINKEELYNENPEVNIQIFELLAPDSEGDEWNYLCPVDWNGKRKPIDSQPIFLALNDSSWGDSDTDDVDLYRFYIDWDNFEDSFVNRKAIELNPFDSTPCNLELGGCKVGDSFSYFDANAQNIMAPAFYRAFKHHESMVFNFVVDVNAGENHSGIRWVELRKTDSKDWYLYQEGSFAPGFETDRFMAGIAMNKNGSIGMAYSEVSSGAPNILITGRLNSDPSGIMTFLEYPAGNGSNGENSYYLNALLNIDPVDDETFWFTSGQRNPISKSRILSFLIDKDSIDLAPLEFVDVHEFGPINSDEKVSFKVINNGYKSNSNFKASLFLDGELVTEKIISDTIHPSKTRVVSFDDAFNISMPRTYTLSIEINSEGDQNISNNKLTKNIERVSQFYASLSLSNIQSDCTKDSNIAIEIKIKNSGIEVINSLDLEYIINGEIEEEKALFLNLETGEEIFEIIDISPNDYESNFLSCKMQIKRINGIVDEFISDDYINFNVLNYKDSREEFKFGILTDAFPQENSWEIREIETGKLVAENGSLSIPNDRINYSLCLSPYSCYIFKIFDSGGNGINCDASNCVAAYFAENDLSFTLAGDFGYETSIGFCMGGDECYLDPSLEVMHPESANSSDGSINIKIENRIESFTYSIGNGVPFQQDPLFENLSAGTYYPEAITTINDCYFRDTIVLGFVNSSINIEHEKPQVIVRPNPNNGEFGLELNGLNSNAELERIEIFTINGELIFLEEDYRGKQSFFLKDCKAGVYLMKCKIANEFFVSRFVVQ